MEVLTVRSRNWGSFFFVIYATLKIYEDIYGEATSSHFFRVTTSTQRLLFRCSYFFRTAAFSTFSEQSLFRWSYFFRIASFSEWSIYRVATSWEQEVVYGSQFSEQLFFSEELFRIKISNRELLFCGRYFCTASDFSEKLHFGKLIFQKSNISYHLLFLESCLFRATSFSKDATFYTSYLFRRAAFLQHTFSEELLFPQLHFLFIC